MVWGSGGLHWVNPRAPSSMESPYGIKGAIFHVQTTTGAWAYDGRDLWFVQSGTEFGRRVLRIDPLDPPNVAGTYGVVGFLPTDNTTAFRGYRGAAIIGDDLYTVQRFESFGLGRNWLWRVDRSDPSNGSAPYGRVAQLPQTPQNRPLPLGILTSIHNDLYGIAGDNLEGGKAVWKFNVNDPPSISGGYGNKGIIRQPSGISNNFLDYAGTGNGLFSRALYAVRYYSPILGSYSEGQALWRIDHENPAGPGTHLIDRVPDVYRPGAMAYGDDLPPAAFMVQS